MHQNLKRNKDRSFLRFTRVYIYCSNTRKPWNKLTKAEQDDKNFKWFCRKWFVVSNGDITEDDMKNHEKNCPEVYEYIEGVNDNVENPAKDWKQCSFWYDIYESFPLTEYDLKLLINVLGLRMVHFINVNRNK